jgi:hypothetical protein
VLARLAWHAWTATNPNDAAANFRSAIHIIAAYFIGDDAELSWSKAVDRFATPSGR